MSCVIYHAISIRCNLYAALCLSVTHMYVVWTHDVTVGVVALAVQGHRQRTLTW